MKCERCDSGDDASLSGLVPGRIWRLCEKCRARFKAWVPVHLHDVKEMKLDPRRPWADRVAARLKKEE